MTDPTLLAIETSGPTASVALAHAGTIAEQTIATPREQTDRLLPIVDSLLGNAGIGLADLDAIVFGRGPGSFTGLRIAAALAQGLALASGRPLVSVSSLAALAQRGLTRPGVADGVDRALCCVDARMGEVYSATYRLDAGLAALEGEERIGAPEAVLPPSGSYEAFGDGLAAYVDPLGSIIAGATAVDSALTARARDLFPLAAEAVNAGRFLSIAEALPVYLREADAWRRY
jgi:tRNA threonylcarbamoyladenosine biosynthesis protein TsaB